MNRTSTGLILTGLVGLTMAVSGCIKNDIPYARIQANILSIEAYGQDAGARIDSLNREVNLYIPERIDISQVKINKYSITPGAVVLDDSLNCLLDLTKPVTVTLRLYQDYDWTIIGNQTIERYFSVENQIGSSVIDVEAHRVIAYVSAHTDLSRLHVEKIKLGPRGWEMTPDLNDRYADFSRPVDITVDYYGTPQIWTVYIDKTEATVSTTGVDAWTNVAWVYGEGEAGKEAGFEYRIAGSTQWTEVPDEWITFDGGKFTGCLRHLSTMTTYEVRAVSGQDLGQVLTFTTGYNFQMPNESFDDWWLDGKVWCPWLEGGEHYWDTGNIGATTLGASNVCPTDTTSSGQGWAARLKTEFKGFGSVGKLAAGSIFVGYFVRTDKTNGILSFGRPCDQRPTKVRGYLKYTTAPISDASTEFKSIIGQPDTCIVWCSLIDTNEPFEIRTNPQNRQLFDPAGSYVIAYGKVEYGETIPDYIPFEFELNYTSTSRVPKYILLTASSSKYGDYFTGGRGATLYIDDLELLYDY